MPKRFKTQAFLLVVSFSFFARDAPAWQSSDPSKDPRLMAEVVTPDGETSVKKLNDVTGQLSVDLGSTVRLLVDPQCSACSGKVVKLLQDGAERNEWKDRPLPAALVDNKLPPLTPGAIVVTIQITKADSTTASGDYVVRFELPYRWWVVADTVAYAVTRQQGNTAIAGAGAFFDFPQWGILKKTKGFLRWSLVVHLLPPARKDDPADVGIAPIGLSLFGNRVVVGIGWNISRKGLRPNEHNRYVYVGFSASQLLNPSP